ncbi:hypothetical protein SEA_PCORAL7_73 [Gordonia phage PCoral7]|uniref:Uncharacterized protein n=1 Tax=Gordonia phage Toast TaxID=2599852 RepID=A0A5J6TH20_9CAUD|nr:DNA binding protein [Gordonia phage Toast]QFG08132.1 hypothetical protein PBI_TOAST_73 [Gordonia phage Toast]UVF60581.1 hypothetical protein SEA_PCORAL7_73 [Gordonia phage PCoral7]
MTGRDVVDEIDALIDAQLDAGEDGQAQRAAAADRRCGHCNRAWHGLAITARMEEMRREYAQRAAEAEDRGEEPEYASSAILDDYRYADDDSAVLCPGSEFIGPLTAAQVEAHTCQCDWCRLRRSRQQLVADMTIDPRWRDTVVDPSTMYPPEMQWPVMRDPLNPAPWVAYRTDDYRTGSARWWRLDLTTHQNVDEFTFETEGVGAVRSMVGPAGRTSLIVRLVDGRTGMTPLVTDPATGNHAHYTVDDDRRPLTLDVYAGRPHDLGGLVTWHEVDGPGGNYVRSRAVIPTTRIDQWFYDRGLSFLAPREMRTAVDRLLDAVGVVPWQREILNRWVNGIRDGAPYFMGRQPQRGDRVGYEIGGRVYNGVVTDIEPGPRGDDTVLSFDGSRTTDEFSITLNDPDSSSIRRLFGLVDGMADGVL